MNTPPPTALQEQLVQAKAQIAALEERLVRAKAEIAALQEQLCTAEKFSVIGMFVAGVAHELNNPLAAISANIQSFPELDKAEKVKKRLAMLDHAVSRCRIITDRLLSYSRQSRSDNERIALNDVVDETVDLLEIQLKKDNVSVKKSLTPVAEFTGSSAEISQVLTNLIVNAKDAVTAKEGDEQRVIAVRTYERRIGGASQICLEVRDEGMGIEPASLGRIMEPFFSTKEEGKGTGLGLWVTSRIVEKHGGSLDVVSEPGKGSVFTARFPVDAGGA